MASGCIFCGKSGGITREHLFAQWIDNIYPELVNQRARASIEKDDHVRSFDSQMFELNVKAVCGPCNSGWMNRIEEKVSPILSPMLRDKSWTRFRPVHQQIVASWAIKTALVLQQFHPSESLVPESEYRRFYVEQMPLGSHNVFVGFRQELAGKNGSPMFFDSFEREITGFNLPEGYSSEAARRFIDEHTAYRIIFTVGHVVFVVVGHSFPVDITLNLAPLLVNALQQIWPLRRVFTWPCKPLDEVGGLQALHESFDAR